MLDLKMIIGFFISCCVGSRNSRFYCPSHTTRIIESDELSILKKILVQVKGLKRLFLGKEHINIPIPVASAQLTSPTIDQNPMVTHNDPADQVQETPDVDVDVHNGDALLRRSYRLADL